jgi:hypothetical protein
LQEWAEQAAVSLSDDDLAALSEMAGGLPGVVGALFEELSRQPQRSARHRLSHHVQQLALYVLRSLPAPQRQLVELAATGPGSLAIDPERMIVARQLEAQGLVTTSGRQIVLHPVFRSFYAPSEG